MNILNNLTIKNLKLNKKRTVVTIIGIMLSVALITAVTSLFFSARDSLINYEINDSGNFHYAFLDVPATDLNVFEENRYIESNYYTQNIGYAYLKESKNDYKPYAYVKAFTKEAINNLGLTLTEGRYPEKPNEILIPTHLKTNGRIEYKVGDTIALEVGKRVSDGYELFQSSPYSEENNEEIIDIVTKEYKIVGITTRPSSIIEHYSAPGYTFITYLDESSITGTIDIYSRYTKEGIKRDSQITADILGVDHKIYQQYIGREGIFYDTEEEAQKIHNQIQEEMEKAKYKTDSNYYLIMLESGLFVESTTRSLAVVVIIVCCIIIFTSVFCIKNSFDISITEKTKQYGMLSSIGATKKQIKKNVYFEAFILGIIGIPLGILLGLLAAFILIIISNYFLRGMLNVDLIFSFSYLAILFAIILGAVTIYLSAWRSAYRASKIAPITAIRSSNDIKIKSKKIKSPKYIKKIFGIGGEVSYKNLKRNNKKYRTTVISIVICVSVFIALYSFINLAFEVIKTEYATTDYNINLGYNPQNNPETISKFHEVLNLDSIEEYSILHQHTLSIENPKYTDEYLEINTTANEVHTYEDEEGNLVEEPPTEIVSVYSVGDEAYKKYLTELGLTYEEAKDKLILINYVELWKSSSDGKTGSTVTVPVFDIEKGQTLTSTKRAEKEKITKEYEVIEKTAERPFGVSNNYTVIGIVSDDYFLESVNPELDYEEISIYSSDANKLQDEIDELLKDVETEYHLINVEEQKQMMESFYTLLAIFLYGFIIVIALIGVTNIFNTITTNMELRRQEFAMLKSIGMTTKEFNRMIRLESFFYGSKSLIIGIPIGCLLSYWLHKLLTNGDLSMIYKLPLTAILICILAVFILISCIMKYSINKINKQNTIETIRNENI